MNSSPFWEAFNQPEQLAKRVAVPISALESVDMSPYQKDPVGFARDVLGIKLWDQTAGTLKAIASWNGKVRLLTPLEQWTATLSSGLFHPPAPKGPGRSLLDWTIYSGWPGNSPPKKDPRRRVAGAGDEVEAARYSPAVKRIYPARYYQSTPR